MILLPFFRARRWCVRFAITILAIEALFLVFVPRARTAIESLVSSGKPAVLGFPGEAVLLGIGFVALIFASSLGTSLGRQNEMREFSWTRPLGRSLMSLQFYAVDLLTLFLAFCFCSALVFLDLALLELLSYGVFTQVIPVLFQIASVTVMLYGLSQLVSCWVPKRGEIYAGLLWPVMIVASTVADIHGPLLPIGVRQAFRVIDVINPLSYIGSQGGGLVVNGSYGEAAASAAAANLQGLDPTLSTSNTLIAFGFGILFLIIATLVWRRREV